MKLQQQFYLYLHKFKFLEDVFWFLAIIFGIHLFMQITGIYTHYLVKENLLKFHEIEDLLAHQISSSVFWLITTLTGNHARLLNNTIYFAGGGYISVTRGCSGLIQIYKWIAYMLLFPGPWKHKLWYVPVGIIILHLENIFRIFILSIVVKYYPNHFEFMHIWGMRVFYYAIVFLLWVVWVEKIRSKDKIRKKSYSR